MEIDFSLLNGIFFGFIALMMKEVSRGEEARKLAV